MLAPTLRRRVSADYKFLFADAFELDPGTASTARVVSGVGLFANNSFEPAPLHFFEKRFGIVTDRAGVADRIARSRAEFLKHVLSQLQRQPDQAFAVELKKVE